MASSIEQEAALAIKRSSEPEAVSETDRDDLKAKLDDFTRGLEAQVGEFRQHGKLSDQHQSMMSEIERHRDRIQIKLDLVEACGTARDVIKAEIEGEFDSLADKLALLDERLDADEMGAVASAWGKIATGPKSTSKKTISRLYPSAVAGLST